MSETESQKDTTGADGTATAHAVRAVVNEGRARGLTAAAQRLYTEEVSSSKTYSSEEVVAILMGIRAELLNEARVLV